MKNYSGQCACGKVTFVCHDNPLFTQYCHCQKCREIAALSTTKKDNEGYGFTAAYLTKNFTVTSEKNQLEEVIRNNSTLFLCKDCHSLIYGISRDPNLQAGIGINANNFNFKNLPDEFKPVRHTWYVNRIINFDDALPKFKDSPKEQGGTGELYV